MTAPRTLRAIPTLLRVGFAGAVAYRSEFFVWILSTNMPLVMLALFHEVAREAPIGGFGQKDLTAYFLVTLIVRLMTGSWVVWEMNMEIRGGEIAMRILRPIHPFLAYACDNLAAIPIRALIILPIAITAVVWAGPEHLAHDPGHWAIGLVALFGAWALTFASMILVGTLGLYWESSLALYDLWLAGFFIFSGYLMPLELFPAWLRGATWWMPFRYTLAFPVEAMLGRGSVHDALRSLLAQWAWIVGLVGSAQLLWRRGLARYAVFGG
jgi:ABC-2 type transport system permease protein